MRSGRSRAWPPRSPGSPRAPLDPPDGAATLPPVTTEVVNFTSGEAAGTSIALDGELVVGRSNAELPGLRDDPEMSRVHARIWRTDAGELRVEDLGSRNGTFLNGGRIRGPHVIQPGDSLRVGRTTMELVEDEAPRGAPSYDALVEDDEPTG